MSRKTIEAENEPEHKIPGHLSESSQEWVKQILEDFDLEKYHFEMVCHAAEALDRATEARRLIADQGATVIDRFGTPKINPAVTVEVMNKKLYAQLMRELRFDHEELGDGVRRPRAPEGR